MAFIINLKNLEMKAHPKFEGVKIGYILTKEKHPELSITVLEISPGAEIPLHTHEKEVDTIFVLEGTAKIYIEDTWKMVKKGDVIVISPKEVHGVKTLGKKPFKCYIVHAPALW
jgi:quercetin dioxygenase-like cupin family protein